MVKWGFIESLLYTSSVPESEKEEVINRLIVLDDLGVENEFAVLEYYEIVNDLQSRQLNKIKYGFAYGQAEIIQELNKL